MIRLFLVACALLLIGHHAKKNEIELFFDACDSDDSRGLTELELEVCISESTYAGVLQADVLMKMLDKDKNGILSQVEYAYLFEALKTAKEKGNFEYIDAKGERRCPLLLTARLA